MPKDRNVLPVKHIERKKALWKDIINFSKNKYLLALGLVAVGLLGIVIPIIPGLFLIFLAIALFKKGWMAKFRKRFRLWKFK